MGKAIDLRLHGIQFQDAVKRMISAPVPAKPAPAPKKKKTRQK